MLINGVTKEEQWQQLFEYLLGNQAAWIADVGLKAGLFHAIAEADRPGVSADALAQTLDYSPRYVRVWCRGAYAFDMLEWDEASGYRLAPHMESLLLDPNDPHYLGGRIQLYVAFYEDFRAFPEHLETGEEFPRSEHDPWLIESIKNTTKPDVSMLIEHALPETDNAFDRLKQGGVMLDIGTGGGFHLVRYAETFPEARVVGLELEAESVALARRTIAEAGLEDRVEIRQGDANDIDAERAYDLVTMNVALHETGGPTAYRNVLNRVRRALKLGGSVVVSELPYPDLVSAYREEPVYQMLAGVQFHESLVGCGMITQGQLGELLADAGFTNPRPVEQPMPTRYAMVAEKPAQ